jgi:hypothetical protein
MKQVVVRCYLSIDVITLVVPIMTVMHIPGSSLYRRQSNTIEHMKDPNIRPDKQADDMEVARTTMNLCESY